MKSALLQRIGNSVWRIVILLIVFCSLFIVSKSPVFAQSPTQVPQAAEYLTPNTNADVPKNLHTWTQNVMIEVMSAAVCQLAGIDVIDPQKGCLGIDSKSGKIGYVKSGGGLLGFAAIAIGATYNPPLHTGDYVRYLSQNFGITKSTYAQGFGFQALNPLIPIWSIFRNLAYVFLIIVFLVIGVAIMLRVRIDPRTVMTIQNQIPKIIIALILITFSFAIAGLLIDLMYVSIYLIYSLFAGVLPNASNISPQDISGKTILDVASGMRIWEPAINISLAGKDTINNILNVSPSTGFTFGITDLASAFNNILNFQWQSFSVFNAVYDLISLVTGLKIGAMVANIGSAPIIGTIAGVGAGLAAFNAAEIFLRDVLPFLLIFAIVIIAVLFTLFRVLYMLIVSFVLIILDVIFAPLWILGGLAPGNQTLGFGPWLRDIASNLAVFPAVYAMLILANVVGSKLQNQAGEGIGFAPPLLGNPLAPNFISAIVTLGLFLLTPQAAKMTKAFFKAPKIELGGIGQELGVGKAVVAGFAGGAASRFFKRDQQGNPVGPGAIWLSNRRGRISRTVGRFMGWRRPEEDIRQEAEQRAEQRAGNPPFRRNWRNIARSVRSGDIGAITRRDKPQQAPQPPAEPEAGAQEEPENEHEAP